VTRENKNKIDSRKGLTTKKRENKDCSENSLRLGNKSMKKVSRNVSKHSNKWAPGFRNSKTSLLKDKKGTSRAKNNLKKVKSLRSSIRGLERNDQLNLRLKNYKKQTNIKNRSSTILEDENYKIRENSSKQGLKSHSGEMLPGYSLRHSIKGIKGEKRKSNRMRKQKKSKIQSQFR